MTLNFAPMPMRRPFTVAVALALILPLAACAPTGSNSSAADAPEASASEAAEPSAEPTALADTGSATAEDVLAKLGCAEGETGVMVTRHDPVDKNGLSADGFCTPPSEKELVFFFVGPTMAATDAYLAGTGLETGATDTLYRDGQALILLTDPSLTDRYTSLFGDPVR